MYFSEIYLDEKNPDIHNCLRLTKDNYAMHVMLWKIFKNDNRRNFIFYKNDKIQNISTPIFYVISEDKPQSAAGMFIIKTKLYDPVVLEGQKFNFTLRANPTVSKKIHGKKTRHDVLMNVKYCNKSVKITKNELYLSMDEAAQIWFWNVFPNGDFLVCLPILEQKIIDFILSIKKIEIFNILQSIILGF